MTVSPLVPATADLRDFPFIPVEITRLFNSEFHAIATDAEWRAGVTLWFKSFHQVPAASLPDDDISLARLAELGRDVKGWRKVKEVALRGWVKASDGRLYHQVVAEKALEAWIAKLGQILSSGAGNAKRWGTEFDPEPVITQIIEARALLTRLNPQSRTLKKKPPKSNAGNPDGTPDGIPDGSPDGIPDGSPDGNPDRVPILSQETGTGTRISKPSQGAVVNSTGEAPAKAGDRTAPVGIAIPETPGQVAEWFAYFEALGFSVDKVRTVAMRELCERWVVDRVSRSEMDRAVEAGDAKNRRQPDTPLWYRRFLDELRERKAPGSVGSDAAWWKSATGITEKGREHGLEQGDDEAFPYFRDRVFRICGDGPWTQQLQQGTAKVEGLQRARA